MTTTRIGANGASGAARSQPTDPKLLATLRKDTKVLAARLAKKDPALSGSSPEKKFGMIAKSGSSVQPNDLSQQGANGRALTLSDIDEDVRTHDQSDVKNQGIVAFSVRDALARGAITGDEAWSLRLKHKFPENDTTPGHKSRGGSSAAGGGGSPSGGGGSSGSGGGGS